MKDYNGCLLNILGRMHSKETLWFLSLGCFLASFIFFCLFCCSPLHPKVQSSLSAITLEPSKPDILEFPLEAYTNLGEGLLSTRKKLIQSRFESNLWIKFLEDRVDLKSLNIKGKYRKKDWSFQAYSCYPMSDLDPDFKEKEGYFFSFEPKENQVLVHLYEGKDRFETLFYEIASSSLNESIGSTPLDAYFLKKQKVHWYGQDIFLQTFASKEYPEAVGAERIEFGDKNISFHFLREGECLVYEEGQWTKKEETKGLPLLYLSKVHSRELEIIIWSSTGKTKQKFFLSKTSSPSFQKKTKIDFVGAKTPFKWTVQTGKNRQTLQKGDLWLFDRGQCKKLQSIEELDAYLKFEDIGDLFLIDELVQKKGRREVHGTWVNSKRTDIKREILLLNK